MGQMNITTLHGTAVSVNYEGVPDVCPICHVSVVPRLLIGAMAGTHPHGKFQIAYQCTKNGCQRLFVSLYEQKPGANVVNPYYLKMVAPMEPKRHEFSQVVAEVSPMFVDIFNQAISAESYNLSQLTGIGLRKALEYLVKDYAISQNTEKEAEIKAAFLGVCINNYVSDTNVKECSKRAAWLGNDETHYVRKWEDKDIKDLKLLIKLTVNWIENALLTKKYIEEMT